MLDPMRMLELFDEDADALRSAIAELDAFLAQQPPESTQHAYASRQRENLALELEERGASEAIFAGLQPAVYYPPPAPAPPPAAVAAAAPPPPATPPAPAAYAAPAAAPVADEPAAPPLLPLAQRIRLAQRKEKEAKVAKQREKAERAAALEVSAAADKVAAAQKAEAAQRAARERVAAAAAAKRKISAAAAAASAVASMSAAASSSASACACRPGSADAHRSNSSSRRSSQREVGVVLHAGQEAVVPPAAMGPTVGSMEVLPPEGTEEEEEAEEEEEEAEVEVEVEATVPAAAVVEAAEAVEADAEMAPAAAVPDSSDEVSAAMAAYQAAQGSDSSEEEEEEAEEELLESGASYGDAAAESAGAEHEAASVDEIAAESAEEEEAVAMAVENEERVEADDEFAAAEQAAALAAYEAEAEAAFAAAAVRPKTVERIDLEAPLPRASLAAFLDQDGEGGRSDDEVSDHTEAHRADEEGGGLAEAVHTVDEDEEDEEEEEHDIDDEPQEVDTDRTLVPVAEAEDEVEAALRAIDNPPTPPPRLERRLLLQRLRKLYPHAAEPPLTAALDASGLDFAEAAAALYHQLLIGSSRGAGATGAATRRSAVGRATQHDGNESFACGFSRFDELLGGGMPPSLELLQHHVTSGGALSDALALQRGGPPDAWRWRYVRIALAKPEVYEIVRDVTRNSVDYPERTGGVRWAEVPAGVGPRQHAGTWNVLWTWRQPKLNWDELLPWQRVNHFPQARQLTRKDMLAKHLMRQRQRSERASEAFDIMPLTFALPKESLAFTDAFSRCADEAVAAEAAGTPRPNVWILKPIGLSRGRGISMVDCISDVTYGEAMVIQQYVANPLLLDGYKFDLRLYVLVTSFKPLEAFIYSEGFGRFATEPYSLAPTQTHNLFAHLTNSSIQKEERPDGGSRADAVPACDAEAGGTKVALSQLRRRLEAAGIDVDALWSRVIDVVLRSLYATHEAIGGSAPVNSFELFGYDVLIDEQLKPWLIEVNASPSLARDHPLDHSVKDALLADTLALVAPTYFDRAVWREMLRWRTAERSGGVRAGAHNPSLAAELCALLHGATPRAHGQPPDNLGLYERIAPSAQWSRINGGGAGGEAKSRGGPSPAMGSLRAERANLAAKYL